MGVVSAGNDEANRVDLSASSEDKGASSGCPKGEKVWLRVVFELETLFFF
jgi:hypothetical protein